MCDCNSQGRPWLLKLNNQQYAIATVKDGGDEAPGRGGVNLEPSEFKSSRGTSEGTISEPGRDEAPGRGGLIDILSLPSALPVHMRF